MVKIVFPLFQIRCRNDDSISIRTFERYKYFKIDLPTSTLIGVTRLADPLLMVEIECMAVIPTDRFRPAS